MMRRLLCLACVGLCFSLGGLANASTLEFDFSSTAGADLSFNGTNGKFSFTPDTSGHDFKVTSDTGGTGSAMNLFGTISGTFTIGTITTSGGLSTAPVSGTGTLTILDGANPSLTATISFPSSQGISKFGTGSGSINPNAVVNLSSVHYTGTNSDLQAFAHGLNPTALLGFFNSHTLAQLKSGGQTINVPSYSGSLTAMVPEPGTMILALAGVPALGGFWVSRRRRKANA